jgi:hypothetical protein
MKAIATACEIMGLHLAAIRRPFFLIPASLALCAAIANADIFPPGANAQVMIGLTPGSPTSESFTITPGTSANGSATSGTGSASAFANLATGMLGVETQGTGEPTANATAFEFLVFSGNATVSYSLAVNGAMNNADVDGAAEINAAVDFFNVTNVASPNYFTTGGFGGSEFANGALASNSSQFVAVYGSSVDPSLNFPAGATTVENNSGSAVPVSLDVTGSVNVTAGDLYIVELLLTGSEFDFSATKGQQGVDFIDPAAFSFTDLDGTTFTSSSGEFLADATTVPEPSALVLLSGVLAAFGFVHLFRQRQANARSKAQS